MPSKGKTEDASTPQSSKSTNVEAPQCGFNSARDRRVFDISFANTACTRRAGVILIVFFVRCSVTFIPKSGSGTSDNDVISGEVINYYNYLLLNAVDRVVKTPMYLQDTQTSRERRAGERVYPQRS